VALLGALLQANLACGSNKFHTLDLGLIKALRSLPKVRLVTSVCPSYGWQEVMYLSLVPTFFHRVI